MTDDERAEIEAVGQFADHALLLRVGREEWARRVIAALDRVRNARGDDDPTPAVTPEQVERANEMGRGGGTMRTRSARSPQDDDRNK